MAESNYSELHTEEARHKIMGTSILTVDMNNPHLSLLVSGYLGNERLGHLSQEILSTAHRNQNEEPLGIFTFDFLVFVF